MDIGDKVEKGDVLFTLDDKELQNERSSSVTEIDRAKLELEKADRKFKRNLKLFQNELISEELFDDSRTDYNLATNALERSEKAGGARWLRSFRLQPFAVRRCLSEVKRR